MRIWIQRISHFADHSEFGSSLFISVLITFFFLSYFMLCPIWFCKIDNIVCIIHVECTQEDDYDMHPAIQLFPPFSLVIDNISPVLIGGYLDMQLANQYRYRYSLHSHWSLTKFLLFWLVDTLTRRLGRRVARSAGSCLIHRMTARKTDSSFITCSSSRPWQVTY